MKIHTVQKKSAIMTEHDNALGSREEPKSKTKIGEKQGLNGYELTRSFFDFAFENPDLVSPTECAVFLWLVELNNRLGWPVKFGCPASQTMAATGIKSYNTYRKAFLKLVDWGFVKVVQESRNQYTANIIALSKFNKPLDKALDKALTRHLTKHLKGTYQSTCDINKQGNKETIKPINHETILSAASRGAHKGNGAKNTIELFPIVAQPAPKKEYSLVHRIRLCIEELSPGYVWSAKDAKLAKTLTGKLSHRFQALNSQQAADNDILDGLRFIITNLPAFYLDKWDVGLLVSKFDAICREIGTGRKKTTDEILDEAARLLREGDHEPTFADILNSM